MRARAGEVVTAIAHPDEGPGWLRDQVGHLRLDRDEDLAELHALVTYWRTAAARTACASLLEGMEARVSVANVPEPPKDHLVIVWDAAGLAQAERSLKPRERLVSPYEVGVPFEAAARVTALGWPPGDAQERWLDGVMLQAANATLVYQKAGDSRRTHVAGTLNLVWHACDVRRMSASTREPVEVWNNVMPPETLRLLRVLGPAPTALGAFWLGEAFRCALVPGGRIEVHPGLAGAPRHLAHPVSQGA